MKKLKLGKVFLALLMSGFMIFAGCSAESSGGDDDGSDPVETPSSGSPSSGTPSSGTPVETSETKTGTVSIVVNVDGTVSCSKCGKTYSTKAEAEACEHYKCETCGTVYYSEDDAEDCTSHVTVTFNDVKSTDSYTAQTAVTKTVKSGASVSAPEWTRENYVLSWVDENSVAATFPVTLSVDEVETSKTVTYTAVWTASHKVTFKDASAYEGDTANADVEIEVADGEVISESDVPSWTKTHYTLSWKNDGTAVEVSAITSAKVTADTTYTAVWTEDKKWLVTYKDADGGSNADETEYVYDGEVPAKVPSWTEDGYNLSWSSNVTDVTTTSAIKQAVTFTAVWKEKGQWYGTLDFTTVTTSDDGTTLTSDFKTAESITVKDTTGNTQTVSVTASTSNMKIESNKGLKTQKTDAVVSFTTLSDSKMVLVFTISSASRTITITAPNNEIIVVGQGAKENKKATLSLTLPENSTAFTSSNTTATLNSSAVTLTISNAPKGAWKMNSTSDYTVNYKSIAISELSN